MYMNSVTSYRLWELRFSKQCSWSFMPSGKWCCVVGQPAVPYITKDHTAFIFRVKHFFLDYLTLTMKAIHTIKMTGTITFPKRPESFLKLLIWFGNCNLRNYLRPSLESARPHLNSLQLQTSIQCLTQLEQLPFSLNIQYKVDVSTHLQFIITAVVSDAPVYHSHRPQAPHNTECMSTWTNTHAKF